MYVILSSRVNAMDDFIGPYNLLSLAKEDAEKFNKEDKEQLKIPWNYKVYQLVEVD